jgi:hypothetical protein
MNKGSRIAVAVGVLLLPMASLATLILSRDESPSPALSEVQRVYCGASGNDVTVVEAAVALGMLAEGSSSAALRTSARTFTSIQEWSTTRSQDYARACQDAISADALRRGAQSGTGSSFFPLVGVALGAALTLATTEWKSARDRLKKQAETLRAAVLEFDRTARVHLTEWQTQSTTIPSSEGISQGSAALGSLLMQDLERRESVAGRQAKKDVLALANRLISGPWPTRGHERDKYIANSHEELDQVIQQLLGYASECETGWMRRRLRLN